MSCKKNEMLTIMTNLPDAQRYPAEQFSAVYQQRWRMEAFKPSGIT